MPNYWITISPSMKNHIIALRLCISNEDGLTELPGIFARTQMLNKNPVIATQSFYRLMEKFFEIIVKLPTSTFTDRNMEFDELIKQEIDGNRGAYGHITAHFGVIEEQTAGNLHYHGLLFGAWNLRTFQNWCHDGRASTLFQRLLDSVITCKIPSSLKPPQKKANADINEFKKLSPSHDLFGNDMKQKLQQIENDLLQPYPDASTVEWEAAKLAARYNQHKHSSTCWKNNMKTCRFAMPQSQASKTFFAEIYADENGKIQCKPKISNPPLRGPNAFSQKDERCLVTQMERRDPFEEMEVDFNSITTASVRCNTSIQALTTLIKAEQQHFTLPNTYQNIFTCIKTLFRYYCKFKSYTENMDQKPVMQVQQIEKPKIYYKNS